MANAFHRFSLCTKMIRWLSSRPISVMVVLMSLHIGQPVSIAEDSVKDTVPARCGMSAVFGKTIDPVRDIHFLQVSGFIMWDYDQIWRHWAPEPLRFKVEGAAGTTTSPETRAIVSVGMYALYYLDVKPGSRLISFVEGGIGLIYTDFQVNDPGSPEEVQGLRVNFNPLIGIGLEFKPDIGAPLFGTVRLSHISNGDLHTENRGVNSIVLMVGRFF